MELGELVQKLILDTSDYNKNIDNAITRGGNLKQGLTSLGNLTLAGVAAGVTATGAAIAGLGKVTIDAAPVKALEDAFSGLTESIGIDSDVMMDKLQEGSLGLIAQKDLMASFNTASSLVGKDFAVQLPDAMQYLGKVAASTGQDMDFMLDSLVKGVGRLSPMILDNLGIQVSLEEATQNAAETFGVQASELTKAQQQAGMMNVVLEKLAENTKDMPDITDNATTKMGSFQTSIQDLKDDVGLSLQPSLISIMGIFGEFGTQVMPSLNRAIETFAPIINNFVDGFAKSAIEKIPIFLDNISKIPAWLQENEPIVVGIMGVLAASVSVALYSMATAAWASVSPLLPLIATIALIGAGIALLAAAWKNNWGGIQDKVKNVWEKIKPIFEAIKAWLGEKIPVVIKFFSDLWENTLYPAIQKVWKFLQDYIFPIFQALGKLMGASLSYQLKTLGALFSNVILPALKKVWEFLKTYLFPVFEKLVKWVGKALAPAFEVFKKLLEGIVTVLNHMTNALNNTKMPSWLSGNNSNSYSYTPNRNYSYSSNSTSSQNVNVNIDYNQLARAMQQANNLR